MKKASERDLVNHNSERALGDEGALSVQSLNLLACVLVVAQHTVHRRRSHIAVVAGGEVQSEGDQEVDVVA